TKENETVPHNLTKPESDQDFYLKLSNEHTAFTFVPFHEIDNACEMTCLHSGGKSAAALKMFYQMQFGGGELVDDIPADDASKPKKHKKHKDKSKSKKSHKQNTRGEEEQELKKHIHRGLSFVDFFICVKCWSKICCKKKKDKINIIYTFLRRGFFELFATIFVMLLLLFQIKRQKLLLLPTISCINQLRIKGLQAEKSIKCIEVIQGLSKIISKQKKIVM
ncbi:hypothetical protein RFI_11531, partial [Reticulomyxa filosa]